MRAAILDIETASSPAWLAKQEEGTNANAGAKNPFSGIVTCWVVILPDGTEESWVAPDPTAERDGLVKLQDLLCVTPSFPLIAHNGTDFDYPFIRCRALAHNLPRLARRVHKPKPWGSESLIDTAHPEWAPRPQRAEKGWLYSVTALADLMGIPHDPESIPSKEIPAAWYAGRHAEVLAHCLDDARTLRLVAARLDEGRAA
jgi:hypothetical protein